MKWLIWWLSPRQSSSYWIQRGNYKSVTLLDMRRNNNVIMTSERRRDVVLMSLWRYYCVVCPLGYVEHAPSFQATFNDPTAADAYQRFHDSIWQATEQVHRGLMVVFHGVSASSHPEERIEVFLNSLITGRFDWNFKYVILSYFYRLMAVVFLWSECHWTSLTTSQHWLR